MSRVKKIVLNKQLTIQVVSIFLVINQSLVWIFFEKSALAYLLLKWFGNLFVWVLMSVTSYCLKLLLNKYHCHCLFLL